MDSSLSTNSDITVWGQYSSSSARSLFLSLSLPLSLSFSLYIYIYIHNYIYIYIYIYVWSRINVTKSQLLMVNPAIYPHVMWVKQCHKPPIFWWFILPIKMVSHWGCWIPLLKLTILGTNISKGHFLKWLYITHAYIYIIDVSNVKTAPTKTP